MTVEGYWDFFLSQSVSYAATVQYSSTSHKLLKPTENKFIWRRWFLKNPNKFQQIDRTSRFRLLHERPAFRIKNLSTCCSYKNDPSISRIFKIYFLACFCHLAQMCERASVAEIYFKTDRGRGLQWPHRLRFHEI